MATARNYIKDLHHIAAVVISYMIPYYTASTLCKTIKLILQCRCPTLRIYAQKSGYNLTEGKSARVMSVCVTIYNYIAICSYGYKLETKTFRQSLLQQLRHTQNSYTHNHMHRDTLKSPTVLLKRRPVHYSLTRQLFRCVVRHRQPRQLDMVETVTGVKITNTYR